MLCLFRSTAPAISLSLTTTAIASSAATNHSRPPFRCRIQRTFVFATFMSTATTRSRSTMPSPSISQPLYWFAIASLRRLPLRTPQFPRRPHSSFHRPRYLERKVEKLRDGFYNISGATADKTGQLYFVDAHWQRIYRWAPEAHELSIVRDSPLAPVQLAFDRAGNLIVVSYDGNGTIYTFSPDSPGEEITLLKPQPATARSAMTPVLPVNYWRNENDFIEAVPTKRPYQYVSTDGSTFIPAGEDFVTGTLYYGTKMADLLRAFSLARAILESPFT